MNQTVLITTPELGLCVLVAVCLIATRVMWSFVKREPPQEDADAP